MNYLSEKEITLSCVLSLYSCLWLSNILTSSSYARRRPAGEALLARTPKSVPPWAVGKMKPDGHSFDVSSWRDVSSLAESLIWRWTQPRLPGYTYVRKRSQCLKLNFNWQIPKCDWLVYNLCANIKWWRKTIRWSYKQGLACWLRPCLGRRINPCQVLKFTYGHNQRFPRFVPTVYADDCMNLGDNHFTMHAHFNISVHTP